MNKRTNSLCYALIIGLCSVFAVFFFTKRIQADVVLPSEYYFVIDGQNKKTGTDYELKRENAIMQVSAGQSWDPGTTVEWISSETDVIEIDNSVSSQYGSNYVRLVRNGPGYSTITAVIKYGTYSYSISCLVKVDLKIDYSNTETQPAKTTNDRIMKLDSVGQQKRIYLKYVDYESEGSITPVTGSAILASAVTWSSDNESVATVDENGLVTAVGGGKATITATTNTVSASDKALSAKLDVVVAPEFSITFTDSSNNTVTGKSYGSDKNQNAILKGVPSNFVIESNATLAKNLKWEVIDCSTGKKIAEGKSSKMNYSVSEISGNVTFTGVKAGTYKIYAFANSSYNSSTNAPYAYLKIIVPIDISDINLVMNVGDSYSLIDNTNITGVGFFGSPTYIVGSQNDVLFDTSSYVIKARKEGKVTFQLMYNSSLNLFDSDYIVPVITVNVTVIDGIALSATNATIYTKGTLLLTALVTNPSESIEWSSDNPSVATVENGLVTGLKAGTATITASQTVKGVVKKASCIVTVQPTVTKIEVTPSTKILNIGDFATLHAEVTPSNLSNVTLQWKSSDEKVVKIVEANPLTATIQGLAGGNAVISAINQDNVVVGYCHVSVKQAVSSITLSETSAVLQSGQKSFQIRAIVYPENAYDKTIIWTSTDNSVAKVNDNGLVTIVKPGKATIIATSKDNPAVTAMCNITVEVPVSSVSLDEKNKTMYVGDKARLSYLLQPSDASNNTVTWTSTNPSVASVDGNGLVKAKSVGTAVIIIKTSDGSMSDYCTITVKQTASSIKLDVSKLQLKVGEYYYIKAETVPKNATDVDLTWESSDTKVATVDSDGKVMAKSQGTAFITAKLKTGGMAYCEVTVRQPVTGVMLNFTDKTIYTGGSFELSASVIPSSATNLDVTWKSSNEKVATVSKKGEVKGLTGGTAIITCTTVDGGYTASCVVLVKEAVTNITLNHDSYNLGLGKSFNLVATVTSENATNQHVIWVSSDENVAVVNDKGKVTGVKLGYATITAVAEDGSGAEASCEIRVVKPVESVTLNKTYMTLYVGDSASLKATVKPQKATIKSLIWTSSDTSVAIVDDDGVVTALKAGNVTITAKAQDSSGKKATCTLYVFDRVPSTGITLQDKKITLVQGESKIINVVLTPTNSTDGVTWSTDNAAVASVDKKTGKITAKGTGTAYVTAMTDTGKTATVEVTVIGLNITELTLEQYTTYPNQLVVEGATGQVVWSIDNPAVAEVRNGYVSSRAVGKATITATVNGKKLKCKLTVVKIK